MNAFTPTATSFARPAMVKKGRKGQSQWIETHKKPTVRRSRRGMFFSPDDGLGFYATRRARGRSTTPRASHAIPLWHDDRNVDAPENLNLCSEVTLAASGGGKHFCLVADLERRMNTLFFATSAQVRSGEHSTTDLTIVSFVFSNGVTEACACGC